MVDHDAEDARPSKRPRSDPGLDGPADYASQDPTFWFADGNIILVSADHKGYRIHRGVLALHAEFFQDMFTLAHSESYNNASPTECTRLPLTDSAEDLTYLLEQFYKPVFFPDKCISFQRLASLLRLATKYLCRQLRMDIIAHLSLIYKPPSYPKEILPEKPKLVPSADALTHAMYAIQMGRENDIPHILPVAFYYACTVSTPDHISIAPILSPENELVLLRGRAQLLEDVHSEAWSFLRTHDEDESDCAGGKCRLTRFEAVQECAFDTDSALQLFCNDMPHDDYGKRIAQPGRAAKEDQICYTCYEDWAKAEKEGYIKVYVWDKLPSYFGLDPWAKKI